MEKKVIVPALMMGLASLAAHGQQLDRMQWFNEPEQWRIDNDRLTMHVTPHTDYWRVSHYGFTVDDAPLLYTLRGGEFEVQVRVEGDYATRFDQAGLMLRIDHEHWIKTGIEFVEGRCNLSTVVTHGTSDWSIIPLDVRPECVWIKAVRRLDAVEIFYSLDGRNYTMMRNAWLQDNTPVMVGLMGASPDGAGFEARFDNFRITHLPDRRRTEWLDRNSAE